MNDPKEGGHEENEEQQQPPGPSLGLLYSLVVLALVVAIGIAALIVLPFYRRR
jgi:hypothetical protein